MDFWAWLVESKAKLSVVLLGALGGVVLRMIHRPPRIWLDVVRHLAVTLIFVIFLAQPIANAVAGYFEADSTDDSLFISVGLVLGFLGRDLIDLTVDALINRMRR